MSSYDQHQVPPSASQLNSMGGASRGLHGDRELLFRAGSWTVMLSMSELIVSFAMEPTTNTCYNNRNAFVFLVFLLGIWFTILSKVLLLPRAGISKAIEIVALMLNLSVIGARFCPLLFC